MRPPPAVASLRGQNEPDYFRGSIVQRDRGHSTPSIKTNRSRLLENRSHYMVGAVSQSDFPSQQSLSQHCVLQISALEPIYHDIEQERVIRAGAPTRPLSPVRPLVYQAPFHRPHIDGKQHMQHLQTSLTTQPSRQPRNAVRLAARRTPQVNKKYEPQQRPSLLMFSDSFENSSVLTGLSQQELLQKKDKMKERKTENKYGKKKESRKKEGRILNMPAILRLNNKVEEPKRYMRGVNEPPSEKRRSLLSRYASVMRNKPEIRSHSPLCHESTQRGVAFESQSSEDQSSTQDSSTSGDPHSFDFRYSMERAEIMHRSDFPFLSTSASTAASRGVRIEQSRQGAASINGGSLMALRRVQQRTSGYKGGEHLVPIAPRSCPAAEGQLSGQHQRKYQGHPNDKDPYNPITPLRNTEDAVSTKVSGSTHSGFNKRNSHEYAGPVDVDDCSGPVDLDDSVVDDHPDGSPVSVMATCELYKGHPSHLPEPTPLIRRNPPPPSAIKPKSILRKSTRRAFAQEEYTSDDPSATTTESSRGNGNRVVFMGHEKESPSALDPPSDLSFIYIGENESVTDDVSPGLDPAHSSEMENDVSHVFTGQGESIIEDFSVAVETSHSSATDCDPKPNCAQGIEPPSPTRSPPIALERTTSSEMSPPISMTRSSSSEPFDVLKYGRPISMDRSFSSEQPFDVIRNKGSEKRFGDATSSSDSVETPISIPPPPPEDDFMWANGAELSPIREYKGESRLSPLQNGQFQEQQKIQEDWVENGEQFDEGYEDDGNDQNFIVVVAAVVIQTAVRRFLAVQIFEQMLEEFSAQDFVDAEDHLGAFPRERRDVTVSEKLSPARSICLDDLVSYAQSPIRSPGRDRHVCFSDSPTSNQKREMIEQQHDREFENMTYKMFILAALKIQTAFRGWWVRDSLHVDHYCAKTIQRAARGYLCRVNYHYDLFRIVLTQSFVRMFLSRQFAAYKISFVICIQAIVRGYLLRREIKTFTEEERIFEKVAERGQGYSEDYNEDDLDDEFELFDLAAIIIQTRWRSYDAQMNYLHHIADVLVAQSVVRRWLVMNHIFALRARSKSCFLKQKESGMNISNHQRDVRLNGGIGSGRARDETNTSQQRDAGRETFGSATSFWKQKTQTNARPPAAPRHY